MGAARNHEDAEQPGPLSKEMLEFADHLAELLAAEFVSAMKEEADAGSSVRDAHIAHREHA